MQNENANSKLNSESNLEKYGYKQELKRSLGLKELLVYGFAFMGPLAPVTIYGFVAQSGFGMVPLVYIVGIIAMTFTAISYSRMSSEFPIAGSVYNYVQRGINPHVGFIAGWLIMIDYFILPSTVYLFTALWLQDLVPGVPFTVWVLIFVVFNTVVNFFGVEFTAKTSFVLVGIQFVLFLIFVFTGIAFIMKNGGFTTAPFYQPGVINPSFISTATSTAVLSFLGFDAISTLGEEVRSPEKNIGRATILSLLLLGGIFIIQTYIAGCAFPDYAKLDPTNAFFDIAGTVGGNGLKLALIAALVGGNIAASMVAQSSVARIFYSLSRDKMLPRFFGKIHPKYHTPYLSIVFSAVITSALALFVNIENIIKLVNFGALSSFIMLNFAVFWFFYIKKKKRGGSGFFNYVILPLLGMAIIGFVWSGLDSTTKMIGAAWLVVGIIYGAVKSKGYKEVPDAFKNLEL